jgi:hypothetical protein
MGDRFYFKGTSGGGQPPADSIEFVSVNRGGYGFNRVCPGPVLVHYSLEPLGNARDAFVLRRDEDSWAALIAEADGQTSQIDEATDGDETEFCAKFESRPLLYCQDSGGDLPGNCIRVFGLKFRYYDKAINGFRDDWDSTQTDPPGTIPRIPAAVQIALYLADGRGRIQEFTTTADIPLGRDQPVTPRAEDLQDQQGGDTVPAAGSTPTPRG